MTDEVRVKEGESVEAKADALKGSGAPPDAATPEPRPAGKPGRHKKNCACEKCVAKRARRGGSADSPQSAKEAEPVAPRPSVQEQVATLAPMVAFAGTVLTTRFSPEMPYSKEEAEMFATAAVPMLEKYGGALAEYSVEMAFVSVALIQVVPRLPQMRGRDLGDVPAPEAVQAGAGAVTVPPTAHGARPVELVQ